MIHFVYIPGLGDRFDSLRRFALSHWKGRDAHVTLVPMRWRDKSETYEQKYARIAKVIDNLEGETIVLVGESAGGPMALLVFSRHPEKVYTVVTICGYNRGASDIHPVRRRINPALYPLMIVVDRIVPHLSQEVRRHITTIYSTLDRVVTVKHSEISGARRIILRTPGHFPSIVRVLVAGPKRLGIKGL